MTVRKEARTHQCAGGIVLMLYLTTKVERQHCAVLIEAMDVVSHEFSTPTVVSCIAFSV